MNFKQISSYDFNSFIINHNIKSIFQTPEYGFVMANQGYEIVFIGLERDGVLIGASLLLTKKTGKYKYAYAPRGFLFDYTNPYIITEFTKLLKPFLTSLGIVAVKINPILIRKIYNFKDQLAYDNPHYEMTYESLKHNDYYHLGYNNYFESLKPRFEAIIDLTEDEKKLFTNIRKNYRTKIRSAIRNGTKVIQGKTEDLSYLFEFIKEDYEREINYYQDCFGYFAKNNMIDYLYTKIDTNTYLREVQKKLHYYDNLSLDINKRVINANPNKKDSLIRKKINIDKYLNQYNNELLFATEALKNNPNGLVSSAALVIRHGSEITILIDGYKKEFKRLNSKHLLIWQIMQTYKKLGYTKLNLGGMSNVTVDTSKYVGLDNFKLNFGAKMVEYAGDFELITSKTAYKLYKNLVNIQGMIKK